MATATARLDAPRLAGLFGAVIVVALASSARPDETPAPAPRPTTAASYQASQAPPPALTPTPSPTPTPTPAAAPTPTPAPAPTPTPTLAPTQPPAPTPTPAPAPEPSTWTHLETPRPLTVRGRQLSFANLDATDGRLTGQRADGPFAPRKPTLLVHYASWCLPCAAELPEVLALARALADISTIEIPAHTEISKSKSSRGPTRREADIVFVSHDEAPGPQALLASFEDLLAKAHLTAAELPSGLSLRADPDGRFFSALTRGRLPIPDASALPSLWLLDHRGRLVAHLAGPLTAERRAPLLAALEALR